MREMLTTIVRAIFVFVVLCLVSATRPAPRSIYDDPRDAQLDIAESHVDMAPARRQASQDRGTRDHRITVVAIVVEPAAVTSPPRSVTLERSRAPSLGLVPIVFARSSRGPPIG